MSAIKVNKKLCKGCGICIEFCPKKALGKDKTDKAELVAEDKCIKCGLCVSYCPDFAIDLEVDKK